MLRPRPLAPTWLAAMLVLAASASSSYARSASAPAGTGSVEVRLYTDQVVWHTPALERATLELRRDRRHIVTAWATVRPNGTALFELGRFGSGQAQDMAVRPGDELLLHAPGHETVSVPVPLLFASVDPETDRIGGTAAPGADLGLVLYDGTTGRVLHSTDLVAGSDGTFERDVSADADIRPGDYGTVTQQDSSGRFTQVVAAFAVTVSLRNRTVTGVSSAGALTNIVVRAASGGVKGSGSAFRIMVGDPGSAADMVRWSVTLSAQGGSPEAGDAVEISRDEFLLGGVEGRFTVTMPPLTATYTGDGGALDVLGPVAADLTLTTTPPFGPSTVQTIRTDADGLYHAAVAAVPGMAVGLTFRPRPDVTSASTTRLAQLRVAVGTPSFNVAGPTGETYSLQVQDQHGVELARADGRLDGSGIGYGALRSGQTDVAAPVGARLVLRIGSAEAVTVTLPALALRADDVANAVEGSTTPNATVLVVAETAMGTTSQIVSADAAGQFRVALPPKVDMRPGDGGIGAVVLPGGHLAFGVWTVPPLDLDLSDGVVSGVGPPRADVRIAIDQAGIPLWQAETVTRLPAGTSARNWLAAFPPVPWRWHLDIVDGSGGLVPPPAGARITGSVGAQSLQLDVPQLDLTAEAADDVISGMTVPGADVAVVVRSAGEWTTTAVGVTTAADAAGRFAVSVAESYDLQPFDSVEAGVSIGGHVVSRTVAVPGFTVRLDNGSVHGLTAPGVGVVVTYVRGGREIARAESVPQFAWEAEYEVWPTDRQGRRVLPEPGDEVRVVTMADAVEPMVAVVPELDGQWEVRDGAIVGVRGKSSPGGVLSAFLSSLNGADTVSAVAWPVAAADGTFAASFVSSDGAPVKLVPALGLQLVFADRNGERFERWQYEPMLAIEIGGARVGGIGNAPAAANVRVTAPDGREVAESSGQFQADLVWSPGLNQHLNLAAVVAADGRPVPMASGHTLHAAIGRTVIVEELPSFAVTAEWVSGGISGQHPVGTTALVMQTPGCAARANAISQLAVSELAQGRFASTARLPVAPGESVTVSFVAPSGHRVFTQRTRPQVYVRLGESHLTGCAGPLSQVAVSLLDEGGTERATGTASTDPDGSFRLALVDRNGRPVVVTPTDRVVLDAPSEHAAIPLRSMDLVREADGSFTVRVAAGTEVVLRVSFRDDRYPGGAWIERTIRASDADGTLRYAAGDVRGYHRLEDIVRVEVTAILASTEDVSGYGLTAEWIRTPEPPAIFLPFSRR